MDNVAIRQSVLTAIQVKEELSAPAIIFVTRSDVPPSPAAGFLIDLISDQTLPLSFHKQHGSLFSPAEWCHGDGKGYCLHLWNAILLAGGLY
jgi:hypothetical protein